ncbi:MAG: DnaD domain protein [Bacillota bacterium]|nr:DnaD domain protein [Bacillota bacterium]
MKRNDYETIVFDMVCDMTAVPNVLLEYYRDFQLNEKEVLFLLNMIRLHSRSIVLTVESLSENTEFRTAEIEMLLPHLVEEGFLSLDENSVIHLNGLFDKFREVWGWRKAKDLHEKKKEKHQAKGDEVFASLYQKFQEEMGRPLSPVEGEQIKDWYYGLSISGELIYEALKRAVLIDKRNFQYINKILLDWQSKGYTSKEDLKKDDAAHGKERSGKSPRSKGTSQNYRGDQESISFNDIFEVK